MDHFEKISEALTALSSADPSEDATHKSCLAVVSHARDLMRDVEKTLSDGLPQVRITFNDFDCPPEFILNPSLNIPTDYPGETDRVSIFKAADLENPYLAMVLGSSVVQACLKLDTMSRHFSELGYGGLRQLEFADQELASQNDADFDFS